jgi:hypothetical protein
MFIARRTPHHSVYVTGIHALRARHEREITAGCRLMGTQLSTSNFLSHACWPNARCPNSHDRRQPREPERGVRAVFA